MKNENSSPSSVLLRWMCAGEVLTGTGLILLGCLLPTLIINWRLSDARAGLLLAAQFAGSSAGAILITGDYLRSLSRGCWLMLAGALSLALFPNPNLAVLRFFVYGLGLGLIMTAISVLAGRVFPRRRGQVLSWLNAWWGLGAVVCPAIVALWVKAWRPQGLFLMMAGFSILLLFGIHSKSSFAAAERPSLETARTDFPLRPIFMFAILAFLYVGVEACLGGWMMSYVHRLAASAYSLPPIAASLFWIALLCGRATAPVVLRQVSESNLLTGCVIGAFAGVLSLLLNHAPLAILLSAAVAGFTVGPIYPLCLAKVMALARDSPSVKWVFAIAGLGGALLPWLTGKLATANGSLRVGLTIPLFALLIMLLLSFGGNLLSESERAA
jgi:FHS family glucose/mannose:H+ symporter-like MFS transporter